MPPRSRSVQRTHVQKESKPLRIRLSGGSGRQRFKNFKNKTEVEDYLTKKSKIPITFTHGNEPCDYVVIPDDAPSPSKTALATSPGGYIRFTTFTIFINEPSRSKSTSRSPSRSSSRSSRSSSRSSRSTSRSSSRSSRSTSRSTSRSASRSANKGCRSVSCSKGSVQCSSKKSNPTMLVRLSGGSGRQHFEGFKNKTEVEKYLHKISKYNLEFTKGAKKSDYVIVPDDVPMPSKTASATASCGYLNFTDFVSMIDKKK